MKNKKITVIGLGYIGLPTTLFFAKAGYIVKGVDINAKIVSKLNSGEITFEEPGLAELFGLVQDNVSFSVEPDKSDLFIITVPTPFLKNKTIDERYIDSAFESITPFLKKGDGVVLESTVPPMITEKLIEKINLLGFSVGEDIYLGHVPETIIPGNMIKEFMTNKRLIGGVNTDSAEKIAEFYRPVVTGEIILTDLRTAEFVKVIENTYRDVNIALANELMHIADAMDIDINVAIDIANKHPRVNLHTPGPGVGGHCISVDPWFLVGLFPEKTDIIHTARKINDEQPMYMFKKLESEHSLLGKTIGIYGLAYKPNIDDFRESPSFTFIDILKGKGYSYISYDPWANTKIEEKQTKEFQDFCTSADIIVIYVAHSHIKENRAALEGKTVFEAMKM